VSSPNETNETHLDGDGPGRPILRIPQLKRSRRSRSPRQPEPDLHALGSLPCSEVELDGCSLEETVDGDSIRRAQGASKDVLVATRRNEVHDDPDGITRLDESPRRRVEVEEEPFFARPDRLKESTPQFDTLLQRMRLVASRRDTEPTRVVDEDGLRVGGVKQRETVVEECIESGQSIVCIGLSGTLGSRVPVPQLVQRDGDGVGDLWAEKG